MSKSTCSVPECGEPVNSLGMCKPHYRKDYYQRNKARENANNKAYLEARPEYQKARFKAWYEDKFATEIAQRAAARAAKIAASAKACTRCGEVKDKDDFHQDPRRVDGRYSWCKECFYTHCKKNEDKSARLERGRSYYSDPAKRERSLERHRAWSKRNPNIGRHHASRRRARLLENRVGEVSYSAILERDGMICHLCLEDIPSLEVLHFDHVIPLSKGGPHSMDNIKPSHAACNLSKGAKLIA